MRPARQHTRRHSLFALALVLASLLTSPAVAQQQSGPGLPNPTLLTVITNL